MLCFLFGLFTCTVGLVSLLILGPTILHLGRALKAPSERFGRLAPGGCTLPAAAAGLAFLLFGSAFLTFFLVINVAVSAVEVVGRNYLGMPGTIDNATMFVLAAGCPGVPAACAVSYFVVRALFPVQRRRVPRRGME
jgi:hypothetical protein